FLCPHELAHVSSALPFLGSFPDQSLLVHFDGGASLSNFSAFHSVHRDGVPAVSPLTWHWDFVDVAELFSANPISRELIGVLTDDYLSIAGKLMALASYGRDNEALTAAIEREGLARRDH